MKQKNKRKGAVVEIEGKRKRVALRVAFLIPDIFTLTGKELYLFDILPEKCNHFKITNKDVTKIISLYTKIDYLDISMTKVKDIKDIFIPKRLKILVCSRKVTNLDKLGKKKPNLKIILI